MLPLEKQIAPTTKPEQKNLTINSFHNRDASQLLEKCLTEAKLSESIFWTVELHVSGYGKVAITTMQDFLIKYCGNPRIYDNFYMRQKKLEKGGIKKTNEPGVRYMYVELTSLCFQCISREGNQKWNVLALPKVDAKEFKPMAPNQDYIGAVAKSQNIDVKRFPKPVIAGLNEIFWTASNYLPEMNIMDRIAWASQMYCAFLYTSKETKKTKIKPKMWIPWIWYGLTFERENGENPWKVLKKFHEFRETNIKWNSMCLCRGWFLNTTEGVSNLSTQQRLKMAVQSFKFYDKYT
jgi:hypothetical protein